MKDLLEKAGQKLLKAIKREEQTGEAIDSMERRYWEGYVDALNSIESEEK
jgi:hypothetical protein